MSRKPLLLLPLLVVLAGGLYYWRTTSTNAVQRNPWVLYGNIEIREARLAFNGSEPLAEVLVEEGDRVKAGEVLARLDPSLPRQRLKQAQAQVAAHKAQLDKLLAGSRPEEIAAAQAAVAAARARARSTHDSWQRLKKLLQRKLASSEAVELARANARAAIAEQHAAEQKLKLLQTGARAEDIAAARAELAAAEAARDLAAQHFADTELKAPHDGVIRNRLAEPGEFVTPQKPVLTLAFTSPVWVRSYLPENLLGRVRPGIGASIQTDSYPGKTYPGWVGYISPTAEFTPKNVETPELRTRLVYEMRVFACNPNGELRLGMPATITLHPNDEGAGKGDAKPGKHVCDHDE